MSRTTVIALARSIAKCPTATPAPTARTSLSVLAARNRGALGKVQQAMIRAARSECCVRTHVNCPSLVDQAECSVSSSHHDCAHWHDLAATLARISPADSIRATTAADSLAAAGLASGRTRSRRQDRPSDSVAGSVSGSASHPSDLAYQAALAAASADRPCRHRRSSPSESDATLGQAAQIAAAQASLLQRPAGYTALAAAGSALVVAALAHRL